MKKRKQLKANINMLKADIALLKEGISTLYKEVDELIMRPDSFESSQYKAFHKMNITLNRALLFVSRGGGGGIIEQMQEQKEAKESNLVSRIDYQRWMNDIFKGSVSDGPRYLLHIPTGKWMKAEEYFTKYCNSIIKDVSGINLKYPNPKTSRQTI